MKKDYEIPVIEIVEFQTENIEAEVSSLDFDVSDWFGGDE